MKKLQGHKYLIFGILLTSFLLVSCNTTKKTTKSIAAASTKSIYTPIPYNSPNSTPEKRLKNLPPLIITEKRESPIATKYAYLLGVQKEEITNYPLYNFIDIWYGTPYKYAGRTKEGVDCSDLTALLFQSVYNINISGNVTDIYKHCKPLKATKLHEGDLVFFKINSKSLSHVGIYLQNNKFVHASVHSGVIIDDLDEGYYKKYFWGAGRVKKS